LLLGARQPACASLPVLSTHPIIETRRELLLSIHAAVRQVFIASPCG
jgi:hypothetical protein